jgi:hypothetical protein
MIILEDSEIYKKIENIGIVMAVSIKMCTFAQIIEN